MLIPDQSLTIFMVTNMTNNTTTQREKTTKSALRPLFLRFGWTYKIFKCQFCITEKNLL